MNKEEKLQEQIENSNQIKNVKQEQIHDLLFGRELGWQEIIYDLINSEQLDPWDIDIVVLSDGFLARIEKLEEADFFVSGKILLAVALLLRIKSEFLLNKHIKSIDEILFGKKEEKKYSMERIELDEEIPELIPKSPMPRFKRVTLKELMESLNKAIITENRRIKKEITEKNALREATVALPKRKHSIKEKIREIYEKLFGHFKKNPDIKKISFTEFASKDREEKIITFASLLHLDNQKKVWLDQKGHLEEIHIWLRKIYLEYNPDPIEEIQKEIEKLNIEQRKRLKKIDEDFENPLKELFGDLLD